MSEEYYFPEGFLYHGEHTWAKPDGGFIRVGITDYAQKTLNEIVFVEVMPVGEKVTAGEAFGTIESAKAVSDLISPVSGEIVEFNEELNSNPNLTNKDPYGKGWIILIKPGSTCGDSGLMGAEEYADHINRLQ